MCACITCLWWCTGNSYEQLFELSTQLIETSINHVDAFRCITQVFKAFKDAWFVVASFNNEDVTIKYTRKMWFIWKAFWLVMISRFFIVFEKIEQFNDRCIANFDILKKWITTILVFYWKYRTWTIIFSCLHENIV